MSRSLSGDGVALVTGASSGIGAAFARALAEGGHGLILVARREQMLHALAAELGERHGVVVECLPTDLADERQRAALATEVEARGRDVSVLVNCAGFGDYGPLARSEPARNVQQVRVLVEAVVDLDARFLPAMVQAGRGAIVNVASTAGLSAPPGWSVYGAAKAFVIAHSEALAEEVEGSGVTVTAVCPGPVETEFAEPKFVQRLPKFLWCPTDRVVADGLAAVGRGKKRVIPGSPLTRAALRAGGAAPRRMAMTAARRQVTEELEGPSRSAGAEPSRR